MKRPWGSSIASVGGGSMAHSVELTPSEGLLMCFKCLKPSSG